MNGKKVVVIGAGAAGVYATHALKARGVDVLCLEAASDVGGRARAYAKDGYICEMGALAMEPQWSLTRKLNREVGLADEFHFPERIRMGFWRNGKHNLLGMGKLSDQLRWLPQTLAFRGFPAKSLPQIIKFAQAMRREIKNIHATHVDLEKNNFEALLPLGNTNITDYVREHAGQEALDSLVAPLVSFFVLGNTQDCCITHLVALFFQIIEGTKQKQKGDAFFASMERGLHSNFRAAYELDRDSYRLSTPVSRVVIEDGRVQGVQLQDEFIQAEHVVCATTATTALKIIPDLPGAIQKILQTVKYSATYNYMIGDSKKFTPDDFLAECFPNTEPKPFFKTMFNSAQCSDSYAPEGGDLLHCFTSCNHHLALSRMSEQDRRQLVLKEAKRIFPTIPDQPELFECVRWDQAISLDAPGQIIAMYDYEKEHVNDVKGLSLAGEYLYPIACTEGAMISANKAVNRLVDTL